MIIFKNISKIYKMGTTELRALDHASMHIRAGEFVSIIGPSGSGKSTLMNIVGCLDRADEGEYYLDGTEIGSYSPRQLAGVRGRKIGFIFQNFNLIGRMSAYENVELPLIYQGLKSADRKQRTEDALVKVGLWDRRTHKPTELSGGQQQRVAIARALASRPSIFLADEPTGNLDSRTGRDIMDLFHRLHDQGNTIVLITHDAHVAAQATRSIKILDGHVQDLTDPYEIQEVV